MCDACSRPHFRPQPRAWIAAFGAVAALGCGGKSPTQQSTATALAFLAQPTNATAGASIAPSVQVKAVDGAGALVTTFTGTVTIALAANPGAATLTGATSVAAASGIATFSTLSLDKTGTGYTLAATASGLTGATSTAFNIHPGPAAVAAVVGNDLPGLVGYAVNVRPAVRVTDASASPVAGDSVTFAVASGGGSVVNAIVVTDSNGVAQVGKWILGGAPGVNTLTATAAGAGIAGNPVQFTDTGYAEGFTITIDPFGAGVSGASLTAFDSAIAKWERIIYRPLTPVSLSGVTAGTCGPGTPALSGSTTGLVIYASIDSIDGPGKILAQAGPCLVRTTDGLTVVGVMKFDSADVRGLISAGTLNSVVLHEMSHVLGFGTLWGPPSPPTTANCIQLQSTPPGTIQDTYFSCPKAQAQFDSIGGTNYTGGHIVPVENCGTSPFVYPTCGTGTVNGHWRQVVFGNELMVGFLPANPVLSVVTIATQEDLGYTVNYAAADTYTHTFMVQAVGSTPPLALGDDIWRGPRYVVTASGAVRTITR